MGGRPRLPLHGVRLTTPHLGFADQLLLYLWIMPHPRKPGLCHRQPRPQTSPSEYAPQLFDTKAAPLSGPSPYGMSTWEYLNRSTRNDIQAVRSVLGELLGDFPKMHGQELSSRMRIKDDRQFNGALWELILYTALTRSGFSVQVHPEVNESPKRPDFLVRRGQYASYVEARIAWDSSKESESEQSRLETLLDSINKNVRSEEFILGLDVEEIGPNAAPGQHLIGELNVWLQDLATRAEGRFAAPAEEKAPSLQWARSGWSLTFQAFTIPPDEEITHEESSRIIGYTTGAAVWSEAADRIKNSIKKKKSRYGNLEHPLTIALNLQGDFISRRDVEDALLGPQQVSFPVGRSPGPSTWSRSGDGVFGCAAQPRSTGLCTVLVALKLHPWTLGRHDIFTINNP